VSARHYVGLIVVAAIVTLIVTPLVRALSLKFGLVDMPGGRKVHTKPISRLGGIAIAAGLFSAVAVQAYGELRLGWGGSLVGGEDRQFAAVLVGLALIFIVGVVDDILTLSPGVKFAGQIVAAAVPVAAGLRIDFVGNPMGGGLLSLGLLSIPITIFYIVAFANILNLIDGLDGLAAGISAIAGASLLLLAAQGNHLEAASLAAALVGACLGFLRYNFNPASIFMGDSGAMFLGFALATTSLLGVMKSTAAIALAVPLLIVGVPIFDTASAIVRRLRHKRPIQEADKGHIHHRLLGRGFDQRQTVLILYVWSAALGIGAYAVRYAPSLIKLGAFLLLAALTSVMAYWLGLYEAVHQHHDDGAPEE